MLPSVKSAADEDIFEQLKALADKAGAVFTYVSTEIEVDTRRLIKYCLEHGIPVAVPVSGDTELTFYYISDISELSCGRYNILEPTNREHEAVPDENTLCVVPALCADGSGLRLGYGKGYYDRYLSGFCGTSVIICYESFRREVPSEPHDRRADITIFNRK
jgi:5-formyltetrahydrofolate cyclo-ligase